MSAVQRKKSPRAPSMALDDALERAIRIYELEGGTHAAPADTVAGHLGYKSARNGAAIGTIASLRYFGLLERSDGHLSVSKDVEAYKFAPSDKLKKQLIRKWLLNPQIFSDLLQKYETSLPSDGTLKFALIQMGFNPSSADVCLAAFRKSVDFAGYYDGARLNDERDSEAEIENMGIGNEVEANASVTSNVGEINPAPSPTAGPIAGCDRVPVRLSGGRRAWIEIPTPFYATDKDRLKAQIDVLLADDEDDAMEIHA